MPPWNSNGRPLTSSLSIVRFQVSSKETSPCICYFCFSRYQKSVIFDTVPINIHKRKDTVPINIHKRKDTVSINMHKRKDTVPINIHKRKDTLLINIHKIRMEGILQ